MKLRNNVVQEYNTKQVKNVNNIRYYSKLIVFLSFILVFVISLGATAAWLTAQASDEATLVFARNVEIWITGEDGNVGSSIMPEGLTGVLPGQPIQVTSGILLQSSVVDTTSPDAYVRVRFEISTPVGGLYSSNAIVFYDQPNEAYWLRVDFSVKKDGTDVWYVLIDSATGLARVISDGDRYNFLNKAIVVVNRNLTNEMADKDITVSFVAQTFQARNTENPLLDINNPTWIYYV